MRRGSGEKKNVLRSVKRRTSRQRGKKAQPQARVRSIGRRKVFASPSKKMDEEKMQIAAFINDPEDDRPAVERKRFDASAIPEDEIEEMSDALEDQGESEDSDDAMAAAREAVLPFQYADLDVQIALEKYEEICDRWLNVGEGELLTDAERARLYWDNLVSDVDNLNKEELEINFGSEKARIETTFVFFERHRDLLGEDQVETGIYNLWKARQLCSDTFDQLRAMFSLKTVWTSQENPQIGMWQEHTTTDGYDQKQTFLHLMWDIAAQRGYRKRGSMLYEPIYTSKGYQTQSYAPCMSILEFIFSNSSEGHNQTEFLYLSRGANTQSKAKDLEYSLQMLKSHKLPDLELDRHKFSFRNGIFLSRVEYTDKQGATKIKSEFYPYDSPRIRDLDQLKAAPKHFDRDFIEYDEDMDWYDIPTPTLQYLMRYQWGNREDFEEIARFLYMNIGRMLFRPRDLEDWQYMVHLIGTAGTGKSTIITSVLEKIFPRENIVQIANSIQKEFGLGGLVSRGDLFMTVMPDLSRNCQLEVGDLLAMVSGETIMVNIKHQNQRQVPGWPCHLIAAENEFPQNWKDVGNRIGRRSVAYLFNRRVADKDVRTKEIPEDLEAELPAIIVKCVRAYHWYANRYGNFSSESKGWKVFCPRYFIETNAVVASFSNHLRTYFMESGRVTFSSTLMLSEEDFYNDYREYCRSRGISPAITTKAMSYNSVIQEINDTQRLHLEYRKVTEQEYEGQIHWNMPFFFGLGLTSRLSEEEKRAIYMKTPIYRESVNPTLFEEEDSYVESLEEAFRNKLSPEEEELLGYNDSEDEAEEEEYEPKGKEEES